MAKALFAIALCILAILVPLTVHAAAPKKQLLWSELSPAQQQILYPLSADWDNMEAARKRKWLGIAKRYPAMKPAEQTNVQRRMQDWAQLTPQQRETARERYKKLEKLPPEKKSSLQEKWEQYQQLPEEERQQLRATTKARKPAVSVQKAPSGPGMDTSSAGK